MKKSLLLTTLIFSLAVIVKAQPTLTQPSLPPVGMVFQYGNSQVSGLTPGTGGANKTWDFSAVPDSFSLTDKVVNPSSAPDISKFPSANLVLQSEDIFQSGNYDYSYYLLNSSALYSINNLSDYEKINIDFTDSLASSDTTYKFDAKNTPSDNMLIFPITYNSYWIEDYNSLDSAYNVNGVDYVRMYSAERDSNVVDGWGTVITPAGTFNNALRIVTYSTHNSRTDEFTNNMMTIGDVLYGSDTSYSWYVNGNLFPLISIGQISVDDINGGQVSPDYLVSFISSTTTNLINPSGQFLLEGNVYPNPSNGNFSISKADKVIRITDVTGKEVSFNSFESANSLMGVEIQGHEQGMYFITIEYNGQTRMVKATVN